MNNSRKYLPSVATIIILIGMLASGIWAGSKIDDKANAGAKHAEENKTISLQVLVLERKVEHAEEVLNNIDVMQYQQKIIIEDLKEISKRIEEALK